MNESKFNLKINIKSNQISVVASRIARECAVIVIDIDIDINDDDERFEGAHERRRTQLASRQSVDAQVQGQQIEQVDKVKVVVVVVTCRVVVFVEALNGAFCASRRQQQLKRRRQH